MILRPALVLLALLLPIAAAGARDTTRAPAITADTTIALWPQEPRDGASSEHVSANGAVSHVTAPRMDIYRPAQPNGAAVLVIGGGGYDSIGIGKESLPAAAWLQAQGITAAVLYYRLPVDGVPPVAPFQDAQRAMRLLRQHAAELGIDPARIGVMGFSAGGNLAGITATRFGHVFYAPVDAADQLSSRPDFAALLYPVISLLPPLNTTQSSRRLGVQADAAEAYSVQLHVTQRTPPTFLAQAADDPIASVDNSRLMYQALQTQQVSSELHIFPSGGHGWGMGKPGSPVAAWPALFEQWARAQGLLDGATTHASRKASRASAGG